MKTKFLSLFIMLVLLAGIHQAAAQAARFFRIYGPAATQIIAFQPDGAMVWSNAQPGATYTVQTVLSLPAGTNWVDYIQLPTTNNIHTNRLVDFHPPAGMTLVPAGSFIMGNSIGDSDVTDASPTNVCVSAFYMDTNLVNYGQWQSTYNWATNAGYGFDHAGSGKTKNHPVQMVDWFDAVKWCNARSQLAGLTPAYYTDVGLTQVYTNGQLAPTNVNWTANGFRLPTEAEWEKAARGGLSGQRFPWGNLISENQANYFGNTGGYSYDLGPNGFNINFTTGGTPFTSPVGYFAPNGYRLFDMAGNVFEWCWDWYAAPYAGGSDPRGPDTGTYRLLRGGTWNGFASSARCAYRVVNDPTGAFDGIGFRCVRGF